MPATDLPEPLGGLAAQVPPEILKAILPKTAREMAERHAMAARAFMGAGR
jgi:hypothetical protein